MSQVRPRAGLAWGHSVSASHASNSLKKWEEVRMDLTSQDRLRASHREGLSRGSGVRERGRGEASLHQRKRRPTRVLRGTMKFPNPSCGADSCRGDHTPAVFVPGRPSILRLT